jgi:2-oxoglutarate dehydrogenase E2 component (dihydrolipoamide succinyltransferase)
MINNKHLIVPFLGEGIDKVVISAWHVSENQSFQQGDDLVEILADKAIFDLPAPESGMLTRILYQKDQEVVVGQAIGVYK